MNRWVRRRRLILISWSSDHNDNNDYDDSHDDDDLYHNTVTKATNLRCFRCKSATGDGTLHSNDSTPARTADWPSKDGRPVNRENRHLHYAVRVIYALLYAAVFCLGNYNSKERFNTTNMSSSQQQSKERGQWWRETQSVDRDNAGKRDQIHIGEKLQRSMDW